MLVKWQLTSTVQKWRNKIALLKSLEGKQRQEETDTAKLMIIPPMDHTTFHHKGETISHSHHQKTKQVERKLKWEQELWVPFLQMLGVITWEAGHLSFPQVTSTLPRMSHSTFSFNQWGCYSGIQSKIDRELTKIQTKKTIFLVDSTSGVFLGGVWGFKAKTSQSP